MFSKSLISLLKKLENLKISLLFLFNIISSIFSLFSFNLVISFEKISNS